MLSWHFIHGNYQVIHFDQNNHLINLPRKCKIHICTRLLSAKLSNTLQTKIDEICQVAECVTYYQCKTCFKIV